MSGPIIFRISIIVALALSGLPLGASALSLADLDSGASISTVTGSLTFDNFNIVLPDPVDGSPNAFTGIDLSLFEVEVFDDSFGITLLEFDAPLAVAVNQIGSMVIDFDVTANGNTRIDALGLEMTATAIGNGASVEIVERVTGGSGVSQLVTTRVAGGIQQPTDSLIFSDPETFLHISKNITLDVREPQAFLAQLSEFEQTYVTSQIPEPTSAALFVCGYVVVGSALRRRRS